MANKLQVKRSSVPGKVPTTTDLDLGEIAINTYDGKVYMKKSVSGVESIVLLTGSGAGDVIGPASSGDKAIARFNGTAGKTLQNSSATIDDSGNITATSHQSTGTAADKFSVGTTAQRPATPSVGMVRFNTTLNVVEAYHQTLGWVTLSNNFSGAGGTEFTYTYNGETFKVHKFTSSGTFNAATNGTVDILAVAGGGSGGCWWGAGGGAGGAPWSANVSIGAGSHTITIGAGGARTGTSNSYGNNGNNTTVGSLLTAIGGGGGSFNSAGAGRNGGSGGGGGAGGGAGGSGTAGQGTQGGAGYATANNESGGGGGAAVAGGNGGTAGNGGSGGNGTTSFVGTLAATQALLAATSTGENVGGTWYVAGGGGGVGGTRGYGGGSSGPPSSNPDDAMANTGGGGGGHYSGTDGGGGGSGVVLIRYRVA